MDQTEKKTLVFTLTHTVAKEFWQEVVKRGAETEEGRTKILMEFAKQGKLRSLYSTKRSKKRVLDDYAKHYKVQHIRHDVE